MEDNEIDQLWERLDTDDVAQKRYLMYQIFDLLLAECYEQDDEELPGVPERVEKLRGSEGYIYKLSQDFLTSSSTFEKKQKLEKLRDYIL
ncbi:MAG: hypothetical protein ABEJ99_03575 [Candidatus Nanohaloarchaea archaeon]